MLFRSHSSVLAWRIPGTGESGGLPSMGLQSRTRLKRLSSSSSIEYKIIECKIMHMKTFAKVITHPEHINSCGTILWELLVLNCLSFVLLGLVLLVLKKR